MNLPFYKMGIAHITCNLMSPTRKEYLEVLKLIPDSEMERLFKKAAKVGIGIEINASVFTYDNGEELAYKPYRIAKKCGCKFYLGSDSHEVSHLVRAKKIFERAIDILKLTEDDKFHIIKP